PTVLSHSHTILPHDALSTPHAPADLSRVPRGQHLDPRALLVLEPRVDDLGAPVAIALLAFGVAGARGQPLLVAELGPGLLGEVQDRKSTRLNSSHLIYT